VVATLIGLALVGCRSPDPVPSSHDSASDGCAWGEVVAVPSPLDPHAAVVTATPRRAGLLTAGPRSGGWAEAAETVTLVARDVAPSDDLAVALDGVTCLTGLVLPDPGTPWAEVDDRLPEGLYCLDVSRERATYTGSDERFDCYDADGRPVMSLGWPDGATMDVPTFLDDGRFLALRSRRRLGLFDETLGEDGFLVDASVGDLDTRYVHDSLDRHELLPIASGPWAGAIAMLTQVTDQVGDRSIMTNGAIVWSPTEGVLYDASLHGALGDDRPIDGLSYDREPLDGSYDADWTHANGLAVHDGDLWMNLRHHDWLVAIDPDTDTVVTKVGYEGDLALVDDDGGPLPAAEWMFHAHAPLALGDDRFLLYDNGNVRPGTTLEDVTTRVLELQVDRSAGTAVPTVRYHPQGDEAFFANTQGNAVPLDDGALAVLFPGGPDGPEVRVVGPDGVRLGTLTATGSAPAYRVTVWRNLPGDRMD